MQHYIGQLSMFGHDVMHFQRENVFQYQHSELENPAHRCNWKNTKWTL